MKNVFWSWSIICLLSSWLWADGIGKAFKQLQQGNYEAAKVLLDQYSVDDDDNPALHFLYAVYFSNDSLQQYSIDSAYLHLTRSIHQYESLSKAEKLYKRIGIDLDSALSLKSQLEVAAYSTLHDQNDLQQHQHFIDTYATSPYVKKATEVRDSLAFQAAQRTNSIESFETFLKNYPDSKQAQNAQYYYDLFVFDSLTKEKTLRSYERFLLQYPNSQAVNVAQRRIFEITTTDHTIESYDRFIRRFPQSTAVKRALAWLYHLSAAKGKSATFFKKYAHLDISHYKEKYLEASNNLIIPVFHNDLYGFSDLLSVRKIPCQYDSILPPYKCEPITTPWLSFIKEGKLGIIDKTGEKISPAQYDEVEAFNNHLMLVRMNNRYGLLHVEGFNVLPPIFEDIEPLNNLFVKVKQRGKWGLMNLHNYQVVPCRYDDISLQGKSFIIFQQDSLYTFSDNTTLINRLKQSRTISINAVYDDIQWLGNHYVKVASKGKYGILSQNKRTILPVSFDQIQATYKGWITREENDWRVYRSTGTPLIQQNFQYVIANDQHFAAKEEEKWGLFDWQGREKAPFAYDSIALFKDVTLFFKGRKVTGKFRNGTEVALKGFPKVAIEQGNKQSEQYFLLVENTIGKKGLYNQQGKLIVKPYYESIHVLQDNLIAIGAKGKFGLVDSLGKKLLPAKYDGIGELTKGYVPILYKQQFGLYEPKTATLIAPSFDQIPQPCTREDAQVFKVIKEGSIGLINLDQEEILPFDYQQIIPWKDEVVLVQKEGNWMFKHLNMSDSTALNITFDDIQFIKSPDTASPNEEIIFQGRTGEVSGVFSNQKGIIIPFKYRYITNIGSPQAPLFLCEKSFEVGRVEAISVTYCNIEGHILKKYIFTEEELAQLQCTNN